MNRETRLHSSDTFVVVDRSRRRRWILIAGIAAVVLVLGLAFLLMRGGSEEQAGAGAGAAGQVPTVSVIVPGRSQVARADAELAQNELERAQALVSRGFVSKADLDRKRAARDAAAARVRVAQAQLAATRARVGRLDIRAPTSGLILSRDVEIGQVVGPGSGALFRLALGGEMEMRAHLSQEDVAAIRVGMPATVTPVGSDRNYTGTVWQVAPIIDPETRLGEVRIAIPYDSAIKPGGFAEARIGAGATTAPLLPQSAVLSDDEGNYAYIINSKNEVERRNVKIGTVNENGVTIAEGLSGNEAVVLSAGPFLNPGQKVNPRRQAAR